MVVWFEKFIAAIWSLITSPLALIAWLITVAIMYWINSWTNKLLLNKLATATQTGWNTVASVVRRRHPFGVGTRDVLVMKPPRQNYWIAVWTLFFFGGCAVLSWFSILPGPEEQHFKNWAMFAGACIISAGSLVLLVMAFTRIEVSSEGIVLRRLFRRPQQFLLKSITQVALAAKNPATGVKLTFSDSRTLKLLATNEGYGDVMTKIQGKHPDLHRMFVMGRQSNFANKNKDT